MKTNTLCTLAAAMLLAFFAACNSTQPIPATTKFSEKDPFKSTIVKSQNYDIDANTKIHLSPPKNLKPD